MFSNGNRKKNTVSYKLHHDPVFPKNPERAVFLGHPVYKIIICIVRYDYDLCIVCMCCKYMLSEILLFN